MKTPGTHTAVPSAVDKRHSTSADLFPELNPAFRAPILPKAGTVKAKALGALIAGPVSQPTFPHSWRLAAYVDELIDDGWAVLSKDIAFHGRVIAEYRIDPQDPPTRAGIAAHGQRGFIAPHLMGLLAVSTPAVAALVATVLGWLA
ncbi:Uncharacterized protein pbN1_30230 [Aromatoleum bremense]|uniref:hypothetical protein n=1 Tax=Aromatoleum bremense TaxID=76115 RepID=UPI001AEC3239|nr:hypothetical protein [Aromatoleum bremense]QTQ33011.1 Uncharacterized protein pbN1_30230 [Aromatoleum bremense]